MSNDLISREKLIDSLNLCGCYKHENPKAYDTLMLYEILEAIEDQPTAYDVDKVVEDIKINRKGLVISKKLYVTDEVVFHMLLHPVIDIVKQGGIE